MIRSRWEAKGGSIQVTNIKMRKSDFRFGQHFPSQEMVAINVGSKMAKYIVDLHNASLTLSQEETCKLYLEHN